eukprot:CAMPEP_0172531294 /NCGR_PEP_ID=MMETSP1067-20121228/4762_1 /TAXON_ID=265564 ORGANISM="Thalassiosira punctigera, Strain Tpunct2005C2" /NCGR_SAMPLE_ID=MMETSP1067 /ASSEMBLY_ACC=CAM_ASM_000444 /LENGTH=563 /DNA_ID=CAMNT_0013315659 /DNA_START=28 /DNA_END=1716 /DNA_ORIENTATION=+
MMQILDGDGDGSSNNRDMYNGRQIYDFEIDIGGVPNNVTNDALRHNTRTLTTFLQTRASQSTLHFGNQTFHFYPGVYARNIVDFRMYVNGTLSFHRPKVIEAVSSSSVEEKGAIVMDAKDTREVNRPWPCIFIEHSKDLLFSSPDPALADDDKNVDERPIDREYGRKPRGIISGHGSEYWGIPVVGYVQLMEFRPDLLVLQRSSNVVIEYLIFKDAPRWTLNLDVDGLVVRYTSVVARRTEKDGHSGLDMTAFNSDGIDLYGKDVYIHDVDIWNQDDCIAVKDTASNMLFERVHASGVGLTIGSIGKTSVSNITFRDSLLYRSFKGIYMKFRTEDGPGLIENVLYENITIFEPVQWGLWIGPAQQVDNDRPASYPCGTQLCSICWPKVPFTTCKGSNVSRYRNITLRDIHIINPLGSPGVIIGSDLAPIEDIVFDNVVVSKDGETEAQRYKNMDRLELFPGLAQPIEDQYVNYVMLSLYVIVLAFFAVPAVVLITLGFIRCIDSRKSRKNQFQMLFFFVGSIMAVLAMGHYLVNINTTNGTYDENNYFACMGVMKGVATGNTW